MKKSLLLLLLCGCTSWLAAGGLPTTPYIYVQAGAESRVAPDTLTLSFTVATTDKDQANAKAFVSEKSRAVFKYLEAQGIADAAITAFDITVATNFEYEANKRVLTGYTVTRDFTVRLTDFNLYPKLVDGLIGLRIETLRNVQPSYSKAKIDATKLREQALADARQQADGIAATLDAKVTGVFAASPIPFTDIPKTIFGGSGDTPLRMEAFSIRAKSDTGEDKYLFENLVLSERLHVIFLIEPNGVKR
jgi:uncharacterized protein YggE